MKRNQVIMIATAVSLSGLFLGLMLFGFTLENITFGVITTIMSIAIPTFLFEYFSFSKSKKMEARFPDFLRDLSESMRAGMTIPQAIYNSTKTDYGPLSEEIKKLNYMISWGVPFPEAIKTMRKKLRYTPYIDRGLSIILQSYYSGGDIAATTESIADATTSLQNVEKDRESILREQVIIVYVIHLIFIGIVVAMYSVLIPMMSAQPTGGEGFISFGTPPSYAYFKTLFFMTIIIQSISNSLVAGETMESSILAGFKHMAIMVPSSLIIYMIFIYPVRFDVNFSVLEKEVSVGGTVSIYGNIKFEGNPAEDARVEVYLGDSYVYTSADDKGDFTIEIDAPLEKGIYEVTIKAMYNDYEKMLYDQLLVD
jgi:flagellar protein FlaJ